MAEKNRNRCYLRPMTVALLAVMLAGGASMAVNYKSQSMLTPGDHGLLVVEQVQPNHRTAPTALRWTLYRSDGSIEARLIPGTDGPEFDAFPQLFPDPQSGMPVLVWSHHNGLDYDLVFARFDGEGWTPPLDLVATPSDEVRPRAYPAPGEGFHLTWKQPGDRRAFHYALFRVETGIPVRGPEILEPPYDKYTWSIPEGGQDDPGTQRCYHPSGLCVTGPPQEGVVVCDSFSVPVAHGRETCILTRTSAGWAKGICFPSDNGNHIGQALNQRPSSPTCLP